MIEPATPAAASSAIRRRDLPSLLTSTILTAIVGMTLVERAVGSPAAMPDPWLQLGMLAMVAAWATHYLATWMKRAEARVSTRLHHRLSELEAARERSEGRTEGYLEGLSAGASTRGGLRAAP